MFLGINDEINAIPEQIAAHQDQISKSPNVPRLIKPNKAAIPYKRNRATSAPLLAFLHTQADTIPATNNEKATKIPPSALMSVSFSSNAFTTLVAHD